MTCSLPDATALQRSQPKQIEHCHLRFNLIIACALSNEKAPPHIQFNRVEAIADICMIQCSASKYDVEQNGQWKYEHYIAMVVHLQSSGFLPHWLYRSRWKKKVKQIQGDRIQFKAHVPSSFDRAEAECASNLCPWAPAENINVSAEKDNEMT